MRMKRQQELQSLFTLRIKDIFRETIHFHRTCTQHLAVMSNDVWSNKNFKRLPQHRKSYLHGVSETLFSQLYERSLLEWVLIGSDGRQFREGNSEWLKESDEYKLALSGNGSLSTHAWRDALNKGQFKPW